MRRTLLAALVLGVAAVLPSPARALTPAAAPRQFLARAECVLNPQFTVVTRDRSRDYPQTYNTTHRSDGSFTGSTADGSQQVNGSLRGNVFSLQSTYSNGYRYSVTGTLDPRTGNITGTGTDSENKALTFTLNGATRCDGVHPGNPANPDHPAVPANPANPDHPANPGNPGKPGEHDNAGNNGETGEHGKSDNRRNAGRDDEDSDDSERRRAGKCRNASAVANSYLKSMGDRGNQRARGAVVSRVARNTRRNGSFNGVMPCDDRYRNTVRSFVDQQLAGR